MRRVAVVGNSGSGKTTTGRALARMVAVPFIELDAIYHQPGWQPLPVEQFRRRVDHLTAEDGWVLDGNYSAVRDLVWPRADTVVWLDPPRRTVMWRLLHRTVRRAVTRQELWNTNRERYAALATDPAYAHLTVIRIRSREDLARLLGGRTGSGRS